MSGRSDQSWGCDLQMTVTLGGQLMHAGRFAEAVHYYRHAGAAFVGRREHHHALAVYRLLHELLPHCLHTAAMIAEQHRALGELPQAVGWYRFIAQVHERAGRCYPAAQVYRLVLELDPSDQELRTHLATLQLGMGFVHEARGQLSIVAQQLRSTGQWERYFEVVERILTLPPCDPALLREVVRTHLLHGSAHRAVTWLRVLLRAHPGDLEGRRLMAECFAARGQFDLAAASAHRAAMRMEAVGPEHVQTAVRLLRRAAVWNPNNRIIARDLARLDAPAGRYEHEATNVVALRRVGRAQRSLQRSSCG